AIDRSPSPRPPAPLVAARRAAATARRENDFNAVDLPAAATLLAQGAGRLIRTTSDSGVVAVFDRRLATKSYRQTLLATLPPLRRTIDRAQMVAVLAALDLVDTVVSLSTEADPTRIAALAETATAGRAKAAGQPLLDATATKGGLLLDLWAGLESLR